MSKINHEDAFTGLEAAIVLIAFVVVAAVFSYVVLGAGFFTTQKASEAVKTGVESASTNMQIKGSVLGIKSATTDNISALRFQLELAAGGEPIDMTKVTMTWITSSEVEYLAYDADSNSTVGSWGAYTRQNDDNDSLLEKGEVWTVQLNLDTDYELTINEAFKIEIKPATGAVIPLSGRGPAQIDAVNVLTI
jgi:archaeal flagellin FlaB